MAAATINGVVLGMDEVERAAGIQESKVITTLELALGAAKLLGREEAQIDFYSTSPGFNEANMQHSYYQRYYAASVEASARQLREAQAAGVRIHETSVAIGAIQRHLAASTAAAPRLVIALLDWNVVSGRATASYCGHFVVVVACRGGRVYFHNPDDRRLAHGGGGSGGDGDAGSDLKGAARSIEEALFDKARLADGTDEDLIFVAPFAGDAGEAGAGAGAGAEDESEAGGEAGGPVARQRPSSALGVERGLG